MKHIKLYEELSYWTKLIMKEINIISLDNIKVLARGENESSIITQFINWMTKNNIRFHGVGTTIFLENSTFDELLDKIPTYMGGPVIGDFEIKSIDSGDIFLIYLVEGKGFMFP